MFPREYLRCRTQCDTTCSTWYSSETTRRSERERSQWKCHIRWTDEYPSPRFGPSLHIARPLEYFYDNNSENSHKFRKPVAPPANRQHTQWETDCFPFPVSRSRHLSPPCCGGWAISMRERATLLMFRGLQFPQRYETQRSPATCVLGRVMGRGCCNPVKVNKKDFFQVFQGSGIGKIEDNLTNADPLSYTTNGSQGDLGSLISISCVHHPTPQQVSNSSLNYPPKDSRSRGMTWPLPVEDTTWRNQGDSTDWCCGTAVSAFSHKQVRRRPQTSSWHQHLGALVPHTSVEGWSSHPRCVRLELRRVPQALGEGLLGRIE